MVISIITTFSDSLLKAKLIPISRLKSVSQILLVCDVKGPEISKVQYVIPPKWLYIISIHKSFAKLCYLYYIAKKYDSTFLMAYNIFPHGVNAWIVSKLLNKPVLQQFPGSYAELTVSKEISDNSLVKKLPFLAKSVERFNRYVVKKSSFIMVPGRNTTNFLINKLNISRKKIFTIHSSIDISIFKPKEINKEYDLVLAARLTGLKRIDIFLEVINLVKRNFPSLKVALLGEGEEMENLKLLSKKLELDNCIDFLGFQINPEKFYQQSKIFVLTSATEGISTASLEAMACGLPVVASNVGDMSEVVINDQTGYLINDYNNPKEFSDYIIKILSSRKLYNEMSANSVGLIKEKYSFSNATKFWASFLIKNFQKKRIIYYH